MCSSDLGWTSGTHLTGEGKTKWTGLCSCFSFALLLFLWAAAALNVSNSRDLGVKRHLRPTLLFPVKEGKDAVRTVSYHMSPEENKVNSSLTSTN